MNRSDSLSRKNKINYCILIIACAITGITIFQDQSEFKYLRNHPIFSSSLHLPYSNSSRYTNDTHIVQQASLQPIRPQPNDTISIPHNHQEKKKYISIDTTTNESTTSEISQHDNKEKTENNPEASLSHQQLSGNVIEDGKETQNQTKCWRKCPQRLNRIYYNDDSAGLGDRKIIINDLAELAGYLCARLVLPRPRNLLNTMHNSGEHVSEHLLWEDFDNITFAEDDQPAIADIYDELDGIDSNMDFNRENPTWHERYNNHRRIVSTNGKWKQDFKTVQALSWRSSIPNNKNSAVASFVWELHNEFYFNDLTLQQLPRLSTKIRSKLGNAYKPYRMEPHRYYTTEEWVTESSCHYTNEDTTPSHISFLREKLIQRIYDISLLDNSIYGLLHLRRGDSIADCDTSVKRIKEYLSCSLENTASIGNITLLMTSDEENKWYRKEIIGLADAYEHVNILDVDGLIWEIVNQAVVDGVIRDYHLNNYFVYEIGDMFRTWSTDGLIKFYLVRRRSICTDCINVEKRLRQVLGM